LDDQDVSIMKRSITYSETTSSLITSCCRPLLSLFFYPVTNASPSLPLQSVAMETSLSPITSRQGDGCAVYR